MLNETLNGSKADLGEANDPVFPTTDVSGFKFDASAVEDILKRLII